MDVLDKNERIHVTPSYENGDLLLQTVRAYKMEGIVAKKAAALISRTAKIHLLVENENRAGN